MKYLICIFFLLLAPVAHAERLENRTPATGLVFELSNTAKHGSERGERSFRVFMRNVNRTLIGLQHPRMRVVQLRQFSAPAPAKKRGTGHMCEFVPAEGMRKSSRHGAWKC